MLIKKGKLVACDTTPNLLSQIGDKVFELEIASGELESYQNTYRVSNLFHKDNSVIVRIVTDNPPSKTDLTSAAPTLEDLYLYVFEEETALNE